MISKLKLEAKEISPAEVHISDLIDQGLCYHGNIKTDLTETSIYVPRILQETRKRAPYGKARHHHLLRPRL